MAEAVGELQVYRHVWKKHCRLGGGRVEEAPQDCLSCILRSRWPLLTEFKLLTLWQRNNKLVFDESVRITLDMIENVWKNEDVVTVEHTVDITLMVNEIDLSRDVRN